MRAAGSVLEVHRIAVIRGLDTQIELAGNTQFARIQRDANVAPPFGKTVLAKPSASLQSFDRILGRVSVLHFIGRLARKSQDMIVTDRLRGSGSAIAHSH